GGQVQEFAPLEGMELPRGAVVALIDTTQLSLERRQIVAQREAASARGADADEQLRVLEVPRDIAQRAYERTRRLYAERAATAQQLDQAERDYRTLLARIRAARAQRESTGLDVASTAARVEQIADRISRSVVTNPQAGTVLRSGEHTSELQARENLVCRLLPENNEELARRRPRRGHAPLAA